jgi:hypothetical protein
MKITRLLTNTIGTAMLAGALMLAPQAAQARVFISVGIAPPPIPVYAQPICPGDGYIWTPGYWQYTDDGYEWVDGAWVVAPYVGALWTPGYWGYGPGGYFWNAGYWGPTIGYYGGINYGFGYFGVGFYGGYWNGGHFFYNREYNHFGSGFHGDHFYSQHYANFDGRPGGASFARRVENDNRGGTFNNASRGTFNSTTNRGGFGQNPGQNGGRFQQTNQPNRFAGSNEPRGAYNGTANNFAQNRATVQQPAYSQARPGYSFNSGSNSFSNARPAIPVNNLHPSQGSNFNGFGGSSNTRPAAPVNNFHPSQGATQQRSAPAPSFQGGGGGGFHGGGGGGSHGGRR